MSMPKGYKSDHGYATVTTAIGGMDYRTIAEKMQESGYKMNHATARNIFLRAMKKFAEAITTIHTDSFSEDTERIARDPRFQEGIVELIHDIYGVGHKP